LRSFITFSQRLGVLALLNPQAEHVLLALRVYVKARVTVRQYPDATLSVFHGRQLLACYDTAGEPLEPPTLKAAA
jgi:hypothetical protein